MPTHREDVEFPTVDGLKLRGWLFRAETRGPAVIINPGVSVLFCFASLVSSLMLTC
jgi:hypothetical protein